MRSPRPALRRGAHFKISESRWPRDPRLSADQSCAQDADDYIGGEPAPPPGKHTKSLARRPSRPDRAAKDAHFELDVKHDQQAVLLANNAAGPLTPQADAVLAQRKVTSKAHADSARETAITVYLRPESVPQNFDAARVQGRVDAPDIERLTPAKFQHYDGAVQPQH